VRAQMMAIGIGGYRGYKGFTGFDLESYGKGDLDHSIGERPVFAKDPMDDIETETGLWTAAGLAIKAGLPLEVFLQRQGWSEEDIAALKKSPEYEARLAALKMNTLMAQGLDANNQEGGPPTDGTTQTGAGNAA